METPLARLLDREFCCRLRACADNHCCNKRPHNYAIIGNGNVLSMADATGTTNYTINALNQVTQKTLPTHQTVGYTFDAAGNLQTKTDSGGTITYGYNSVDQVSSVTDRLHKQTTIGYTTDGNLQSVAFPNGVTQTSSYNTVGQLTSDVATGCSSGTCPSFSYSYTNPTTSKPTLSLYSMTDAAGNTTNLGYDSTNQLTSAIKKASGGGTLATYGFGYDPAGNLTSKSINGTNTTFTYNGDSQLTSATGGMNLTYSYDLNGDRTAVSDGTSITLNAADQLTSITPPNSAAIPYTYTGVGEQQRIGNGSTKYQYDGTGIGVQNDTLGNTYFTSLPGGGLLSETIPNGNYAGTYYSLGDGLGDVAAVTDSAGAVQDTYTYDPLGGMTATGSVPNPFSFQGGIFDSSTGYYYTGSGYYDPATGQSFGACKDHSHSDGFPGHPFSGEDFCGEDEPPYSEDAGPSFVAVRTAVFGATGADFTANVRVSFAYTGTHVNLVSVSAECSPVGPDTACLSGRTVCLSADPRYAALDCFFTFTSTRKMVLLSYPSTVGDGSQIDLVRYTSQRCSLGGELHSNGATSETGGCGQPYSTVGIESG